MLGTRRQRTAPRTKTHVRRSRLPAAAAHGPQALARATLLEVSPRAPSRDATRPVPWAAWRPAREDQLARASIELHTERTGRPAAAALSWRRRRRVPRPLKHPRKQWRVQRTHERRLGWNRAHLALARAVAARRGVCRRRCAVFGRGGPDASLSRSGTLRGGSGDSRAQRARLRCRVERSRAGPPHLPSWGARALAARSGTGGSGPGAQS